MSKKSKRAVVLDLMSPYGVCAGEGAKTRRKHATLMQDFMELQKEVGVIRSKLDAGKQRKIVLAAEVGFLRKRYEYLVKTETLNSSHKEKPVAKLTKHNKKAALPPIPETKPKKKHYIGKERASPVADLDHKRRVDIKEKVVTQRNTTPVFNTNQKEITRANYITSRNKALTFDLNQDNNNNNNNPQDGNEVFMRRRAHIFDLNEISTGDDDFQSNFEALKFEGVQNDLMSVCRNAGEGPSRVTISWQDPVALRV